MRDFHGCFYDRFTEQFYDLLAQLLDHALDEVAVPQHVSSEYDRFRDVIAADATIFRLQQHLSAFEATHDGASGVMLYERVAHVKRIATRVERLSERNT